MKHLSSHVRRSAVTALAVALGLAVSSLAGCGGKSRAVDGGVDAGPSASPVVVSAATRTPRTTTWSINYWQWAPTYGDDVTGTESLVAALAPAVIRAGGYNNDANTPDPFDDAALDHMVTYARAIGAEPLIQVPHLYDVDGHTPTAATAAAMVTYANVTRGYGVKYFAVGNEPDIYAQQGLLTDNTQPAIPGYTPAAYCASVRPMVEAMKAVDPTIQIVGPDLAYKYVPGSADTDWLTPILTGCGDLFDIVSIHRYPFEAKQATLVAAQADAASFRAAIAGVRGILQATGYAGKPLALMEMNVVYDATSCVLDGSPGTVGSALWLADGLGAAIDLGLWTSAVWDVSDDDNYSLGIIGTAPAHTPRPEYYAYALYAEHFGPTLLDVVSAPPDVSIHASRNAADDATEIIALNWSQAPAALAFQITGLPTAPAPATFVLPAASLAAIEIPDSGPAKAWSYGEAQREAAVGPQPLAAGTGGGGGAGAGGSDGGSAPAGAGAGRVVGTGCAGSAPTTCPEVVVSNPVITSGGERSSNGTLFFGSGDDAWGSFAYATTSPTPPTAAVTSDGNGLQITGGSEGPSDYEGVGLYYNSASCLDAAAYTGVKFDFAGGLGGCALGVGIAFSADLSMSDDAVRGACSGTDSMCYGPIADVTSAARAATASAPTVYVPFSSMIYGAPIAAVDPTQIVSFQWQLLANGGAGAADAGADAGADASSDAAADAASDAAAAPAAGGCSASFTVENVSFY